ncbi:MAG: response regulator [bacterium]
MAVNVLVVDDEESVREVLVDILGANGYCASGVGNGREALEMLRLLEYDMVVSDFHMPEMDGLKLISHIKRLYPGTVTILMTAESLPEIATEARRRGAFDVIFKPFKYTQLLSVLKRGLKHYQNLDRSRRHDRLVAE